MAKSRQQKEESFQSLKDGFANAKSVIFVNFDGLTVTDTQEFRSAIRAEGLSYLVAKKTLLKLALKENNLSEVDESIFERGVGTIFGSDDVVAPAQIVDKFAKDHEAMTILGGVMMENPTGERFMSLAQVEALAKLPSKDVLLGRLLGSINAPVSGFVNVLAGNIRGLVNVLSQIKDQQEA
jgi:large subunit ribosomal protein L10